MSSRSARREVFSIASGKSAKIARISAIALQMTLGILGKQFAGGIEMRVFANAGENIQHLASVRLGVFHAVCGEERQLMRARKIDQFAVNPFFAANEMPLKFDKNIFVSEDVDQKFGAMFRVLGSAGCQPVASGSLPDVSRVSACAG